MQGVANVHICHLQVADEHIANISQNIVVGIVVPDGAGERPVSSGGRHMWTGARLHPCPQTGKIAGGSINTVVTRHFCNN